MNDRADFQSRKSAFIFVNELNLWRGLALVRIILHIFVAIKIKCLHYEEISIYNDCNFDAHLVRT